MDRLLTEPEAAERLKMSAVGLREARYRGEGPEYIRLGRKLIRYREEALAAWVDAMEARTRETEPRPGDNGEVA